jgi:hypothetical protein
MQELRESPLIQPLASFYPAGEKAQMQVRAGGGSGVVRHEAAPPQVSGVRPSVSWLVEPCQPGSTRLVAHTANVP